MSKTTFDKCPHCKQYDWLPHLCPPKYHCQIIENKDGYDDCECNIQAKSPEDAAKKFIEEWDWDDYCELASGKIDDVKVRVMMESDRHTLEELQDHMDVLWNTQQLLMDSARGQEDEEELKDTIKSIAETLTEIQEIQSKSEVFIVSGEIVPQYYARKVSP